MKYSIIETYAAEAANAVEELTNDMMKYLALNWKPSGGVCVIFCPTDRERYTGADGYMAFQAITHDGDGPLPE